MKRRNDRINLTSRHRLRDFDYSQPGYYFLTAVTNKYANLFGSVTNRDNRLSPAGLMLDELIRNVPIEFPTISLEEHVVMPNHFHVLIYQGLDSMHASSPDVMRMIKGQGQHKYSLGVRHENWPPYAGKLWMSGYFDEVIKSEEQLFNVRRYIRENPQRWDEDELKSIKDEGGFRR